MTSKKTVSDERAFATALAWYACDPCEKFRRMIRIPARRSAHIASTLFVRGPIVHTIPVFGGPPGVASMSSARTHARRSPGMRKINLFPLSRV